MSVIDPVKTGSSPRVRGKRDQSQCERRCRGLIPACAGKTRLATWHSCSVQAHPRVCGENHRKSTTPSCVWAHPRVCGENPGLSRPDAYRRGSSPRVRGKRARTRARRRVRVAHPRVCGENASSGKSQLTKKGSSPRVRGKPGKRSFNGGRCGLIPACAGKTCCRSRLLRKVRAHPRVCGENAPPETPRRGLRGSSPRVRGKLDAFTCFNREFRLIPACAGKTRTATPLPGALEAHPRVCGEN